MLLEHFAARYVEPVTGDKMPTKPTSLEHEL